MNQHELTKNLSWAMSLAEEMCCGSYPPDSIERNQLEVRKLHTELRRIVKEHFAQKKR